MRRFGSGRPRGWRGDDDGRVMQVGDEVALEPAQKTLLLVAAERGALAAVRAILKRELRWDVAGLREAVEVRGAGDEGVRRQDEQQQAGRRTRPQKLPHLFL